MGAVFNGDHESGTEKDLNASFGSSTEASRTRFLLPDESPASNPPPQPLFVLRYIVVSGAVVVVVIVIDLPYVSVSAFGVSKRCFDLARTAGVSVGGACGAGFKILDRIDRMLASREVSKAQRTERKEG
ncbi:MAG: hypothetical protein R6U13_07345 [Desulfatiglandaceae bacterium]